MRNITESTLRLFITKLAEALERRIENGQSLFFGQGQKFVQFISFFLHNNRFGYSEYSTNNRIGQVLMQQVY